MGNKYLSLYLQNLLLKDEKPFLVKVMGNVSSNIITVSGSLV